MGQLKTRTVALPDPAATEALGRQLADALGQQPRQWLILLKGQLGAGKSTLARALLRACGHSGPVPSPTYTLIEPYEFPAFSAYHVDLYRISSPEELDYLGWQDLDDGLRLVEWPERIPGLENDADLVIALDYAGEGRTAALTGVSDKGRVLLDGMDLN